MNCNCNNKCRRCEPPCACPTPAFGICEVPDNIGVLRYNVLGKRYDYDYSDLIYQVQTDTSLLADSAKRVLRYMAERHIDSLSAQELGAILHLADLGDVTTKGAVDGSMLVYQKNSNCGEGCTGTGDTWKIWSALDEQISSATYPMVFNGEGKAKVLEQPAHPNQYYQLGWNGKSQLSYSQIPIVSTPPVGTDGKKLAVYVDPTTQQLVAVKED